MVKESLKLLKTHWKEVFKVGLIIVASSILAVVVSEKLKGETFQEYIGKTGIYGPLIVAAYIAASHIVAPLTGTPGTVASLAIYGLYKGILIHYVASLISASANFYIARVLGRTWVVRLTGKESIKRIDNFVNVMGTKLLVIARLVGFPVFEFISYAVGFTNMLFSRYFLITATVSIIPGVIISFLFFKSLASALALSLLLGSTIIIGILFTWYTIMLYLKQQREK